MKQFGLKKFIPGIAWFFVVLVLICLPGKDIHTEGWMNKIFLDKWVHTGIFGLLAFLFMWPLRLTSLSTRQKYQYFIRIGLATSIWGLTTEFIQKYLVAGRSFDLFDWAADSFGALLAVIFCVKVYLKK